MKRIFFIFLFLSLQGFASTELPAQIQGVNLATEKNESVNLRDTRYKAHLVVFLSSHCPCSNCHNAELKKLVEKYPSYQFVGIHSNQDEDFETSKAYFKKAALPFPVIQDDKTKYADLFRAVKTPHAFLLSGKGEILFAGGVSSSKDVAQADRLYLREALTDLEAGREIKTKEARSLGCAISRGPDENIWK